MWPGGRCLGLNYRDNNNTSLIRSLCTLISYEGQCLELGLGHTKCSELAISPTLAKGQWWCPCEQHSLWGPLGPCSVPKAVGPKSGPFPLSVPQLP